MLRTAAREAAIQLGFAVAATGADPRTAVEEFLEQGHSATLAEESEVFAEKPSKKDREFIVNSVVGVTEHKEELDELIGRYAHGWRTERISRSAAAVLRQAMFEILYMPEIPHAAAINEAVELSKGYEEPEVVAFINGVLGGFYRSEVEKTAPESAEPAEPADA